MRPRVRLDPEERVLAPLGNAPSKDAFEEPRAPLPPGHEFARPCPWCGRPLSKRRPEDSFSCQTCGWRGQ